MWGKRKRSRRDRRESSAIRNRRWSRPELLESRMLLAANPVHVGLVYLETDYLNTGVDQGADTLPDRFLLSFTGGAPNTELTEVSISTDKDSDGLSVGDLIFDTLIGGRGKEGAHPLEIVQINAADPQATVQGNVEDGSQLLTLTLTNFRAGDTVEFTLDVDEVLRLSPDLDVFNNRLDVIASGQEFQDSILQATFEAPHYETAYGQDVFENDYGNPAVTWGLQLPPDVSDDPDSRPNRSAAAIAHAQQTPKPISISGSVFVDNNLNLVWDAGEQPIQDVDLALWKQNETSLAYEFTGFTTTTDPSGHYKFGLDLGLMPGVYRVIENQPTGFFSVGAIPGNVAGAPSGMVESLDILADIQMPLGDTAAVQYDFAEAQPASVSGFVFRDDSDDGIRDAGEPGIADVRVQIRPVNTIATQAPLTTRTDANGFYQFDDLVPGRYEIIELDQPAPYTDGLDSAGSVDGVQIGSAINPGDHLVGVQLLGASRGIEYNFGELPLGSIQGHVYLPPAGEDCDSVVPSEWIPLAGVEIQLFNEADVQVATTITAADGSYQFNELPKGTYRIVEITPPDLIDGESMVGTIDGVTVGLELSPSAIGGVQLPAGRDGVHYDFCEAAPAEISGYVYHDESNDGLRGASEKGIENATVILRTPDGATVATAQTNAVGFYRFTNLVPGQYLIEEVTPNGYLDGLDRAGTIDGSIVGSALNPGDSIDAILLKQGQKGIEYNFGELLPAVISGRVHADTDGDCELDPGETPLEGVEIRLLDASGAVIRTALTNASGEYRFEGLAPGVYSVVETQPAGYFDGGQVAGTTGGVTTTQNQIATIPVGSGQESQMNNFCEHPPSVLSGIVFADRDEDCVHDTGELPIEGVKIELLNEAGVVIATTHTNIDGRYEFTDLPKGKYSVRETQPAGFLHGGQRAGSGGGDDSQQDLIQQIEIGWGENLINYDFCEVEPASISGSVFVDSNGDCIHQPALGEHPLANVVIRLHDSTGHVIATTLTNANGNYSFQNLRPGQYRVSEVQPDGYYQGGQLVGSGGGVVLADDLMGQILVGPGQDLVHYDFCEVEGSTLSGRVWKDQSMDRIFDAAEMPLEGVRVDLLDDSGTLVATTLTNSNGFYKFEDLRPGTYTVCEHQPIGYFQGGQIAGSEGGDDSAVDKITAIKLPGGIDAIHYDFPEVPPAKISGFVFQDGPPLDLEEAPAPETLRSYRDGNLSDDDTRIAGVTLELRNLFGFPFSADAALPGYYSGTTIQVVSNEDGYYEFAGLRPNTTYHVYEIQPEGYIDSLDTAGNTLGSLAVNRADLDVIPQLKSLVGNLSLSNFTDPRDDAILGIVTTAGGESRFNNFSEIQIDPSPDGPLKEYPDPPQVTPPNVPLETFPQPEKLIGQYVLPYTQTIPRYAHSSRVSWHLSIINAGSPRGTGIDPATVIIPAASQQLMQRFSVTESNLGEWDLFDESGQSVDYQRSFEIGTSTGKPLVGDFNGDGRDEPALFMEGNWLIDLNGNGTWDPGDLWVMLGSAIDRPVVGDWDGDGKDDVGIFGPEWERDPRAIRRDPGLPDPDNQRRRGQKNLPPDPVDATSGQRLLRRTANGQMRADLIDHVFRYGESSDEPLVGDWNGDGVDTIAVFNAGLWRLDADGDGRWTEIDESAMFGQPGDLPMVGDWNGDGIDELIVVRGDLWIIDVDGDRQITSADLHVRIPRAQGQEPVMGDWDGDGRDEPGYYRFRTEDAGKGDEPKAA